MGLLKRSSGTFQSGLMALAVVSLAGAALAVRLRRAPVFAAPSRNAAAPAES
jgi:hypothetical protein